MALKKTFEHSESLRKDSDIEDEEDWPDDSSLRRLDEMDSAQIQSEKCR